MVSYDCLLIARELIGVGYLLDQSDKILSYDDSLTDDIDDYQDVDERFEDVDETIATFPNSLTELRQQSPLREPGTTTPPDYGLLEEVRYTVKLRPNCKCKL